MAPACSTARPSKRSTSLSGTISLDTVRDISTTVARSSSCSGVTTAEISGSCVIRAFARVEPPNDAERSPSPIRAACSIEVRLGARFETAPLRETSREFVCQGFEMDEPVRSSLGDRRLVALLGLEVSAVETGQLCRD